MLRLLVLFLQAAGHDRLRTATSVDADLLLSPLSAAPLGGAIDFLPSDSKASPGDAAGAALLPPEPGPQIAEKPGPQATAATAVAVATEAAADGASRAGDKALIQHDVTENNLRFIHARWTIWSNPWLFFGLIILPGVTVILAITKLCLTQPPEQEPGRASVTWISTFYAVLFFLVFFAMTIWTLTAPWIFTGDGELWAKNNIAVLWACTGFFIWALLEMTALNVNAVAWIYGYRTAVSTDYHAQHLDNQNRKKDWDSVQHIVIIPNFKEPVDVMRLMLTNLAECAPDGMARGQLHVVLAIEAREGPDAVARADRLRNEFESKFAGILVTVHPADTIGETAGKASNFAHALKEAAVIVRDPSSCLVHCSDADSLYHPSYMAAVTADFCAREDDAVCYQPAVMQGSFNIWTVPIFSRLSSMSTTLEVMNACLPHSTYTYPYSRLASIGEGDASHAQDADVMCEDFHLWLKSVCHDSSMELKTFAIPVSNFAVGDTHPSYIDNLGDKYEQAKRLMFGCAAETCYILDALSVSRKNNSVKSWLQAKRLVTLTFLPFMLGVLVPGAGILSIVAGYRQSMCVADPVHCDESITQVVESTAAFTYMVCSVILFVTLFVVVFILTTCYHLIDTELHRVKTLAMPIADRTPYTPRSCCDGFIMFMRLLVEYGTMSLVTNLIFMLIPLVRAFIVLMVYDHRAMTYVVAKKSLAPGTPDNEEKLDSNMELGVSPPDENPQDM